MQSFACTMFASVVISVASECICHQYAVIANVNLLLCVIAYAANFQLPEEGVLFDKVEFIELQREEAQPLVEKYNKEGRDAQPPDTKRFRGNDSRDRYSSGSRFSTFKFPSGSTDTQSYELTDATWNCCCSNVGCVHMLTVKVCFIDVQFFEMWSQRSSGTVLDCIV